MCGGVGMHCIIIIIHCTANDFLIEEVFGAYTNVNLVKLITSGMALNTACSLT